MSKPAWVSVLERELKDNPKSVTYAFSTLSEENKPKVRYVIHRGLTPSNLLLTTTDTRMSKPAHLSHSPTVEIAWWIEATNVQFRITGEAYTIPPKPDGAAGGFEKIKDGLKLQGDEAEKEWWSKKNDELWGGVSGHLRAGFARPTPGKELGEADKPDSWPESIPAQSESDDPEEKKTIEFAKSHFAIIAVRPTAVEYLELKPVPNRRTQWTLADGGEGEWKERKVAP